MLDYLDKGYFVMFFFGFLIDKINLFPFFLGISLGLFISTNNSTIKYLSLFNESYNYIKMNLDVFIPNDTIIPTNDTIIPTNDTIIPTNNTIIPTNDSNTILSKEIQETTSNNQTNYNKMDDNGNIKSPL